MNNEQFWGSSAHKADIGALHIRRHWLLHFAQ